MMPEPRGRRPSTFRQRDAASLIKAATSAGLKVARVEVDREGKIVIITADQAAAEADMANEWDAVR